MKRYYVFLFMIMSVLFGYAQDYYEHEFGAAIGVFGGPVSQWNKFRDRAVPTGMDSGFKCGGAAIFDGYTQFKYEYSYRFSDRLSVGAMFVAAMNRDSWEKDVQNGVDGIDVESSMISVLPFVKYAWYTSKKYDFRLYSKVGLGVGKLQNASYYWYERVADNDWYYIEKRNSALEESKSCVAFYIVPIAIETKQKHWNWFAELGVGEQVSLTAGLRYSFGKGKNK